MVLPAVLHILEDLLRILTMWGHFGVEAVGNEIDSFDLVDKLPFWISLCCFLTGIYIKNVETAIVVDFLHQFFKLVSFKTFFLKNVTIWHVFLKRMPKTYWWLTLQKPLHRADRLSSQLNLSAAVWGRAAKTNAAGWLEYWDESLKNQNKQEWKLKWVSTRRLFFFHIYRIDLAQMPQIYFHQNYLPFYVSR